MVCAGSGGVGKTTIAAATAVRAAQLGLRTLVLTVDPARRLATTLGLDINNRSNVEQEVTSLRAPGSVSAAIIDSKSVFDDFILRHARQKELVARIMKNRLYMQLSTTLAGSQEFTAIERLLQAVESEKFDLVVLDTPPTQHAMDFLTAPMRINALFQDAVTRWFMAPGERAPGFLAGLVGRGTRAALKSLETLTGAQFIEEMLDFFGAIRTVQSALRERSERAHALLTDQSTQFFVVTSFDAAKLTEAKHLQTDLASLGYHLKGVVINRAFPTGLPRDLIRSGAKVDPETYEKVLKFYKQFKDYYSYRYNLYQEFSRGLDKSVTVVRLPEYARDVCGVEDLEALATTLGAGGMV